METTTSTIVLRETMIKLNLPETEMRFCKKDSGTFVFDPFRKKFVKLTPEEWVRQNFLAWLVNYLGYPKGLIAVEAPLKYNSLQKRADAVIYNKAGSPLMIVECKSAHIEINQDTFSQAASYNFSFRTKYLVLTNGIMHYCCKLDFDNKNYQFLKEIPRYENLA